MKANESIKLALGNMTSQLETFFGPMKCIKFMKSLMICFLINQKQQIFTILTTDISLPMLLKMPSLKEKLLMFNVVLLLQKTTLNGFALREKHWQKMEKPPNFLELFKTLQVSKNQNKNFKVSLTLLFHSLDYWIIKGF